MTMGYRYFMNNPVGARVGDCAVRAISKALNISWEQAYDELATTGYQMADMPSSNNVISAVLRKNGFYKESLPDCKGCFTISEFAKSNPIGTYVVGTGSHVVTVIDGNYYDSWRSDNEPVMYYWSR